MIRGERVIYNAIEIFTETSSSKKERGRKLIKFNEPPFCNPIVLSAPENLSKMTCSGQAVACKHETLNQCRFDVSPPSTTLAQHQINIGSRSRVCFVATENWWLNRHLIARGVCRCTVAVIRVVKGTILTKIWNNRYNKNVPSQIFRY